MAKTKSPQAARHRDEPTETHLQDIMIVSEVATYLRLSKKTVYLKARKGEIPCIIFGSTFRFSRKTIESMF